MRSLAWRERIVVLLVVLLAWALRWIALLDVPPGWRDDDLIELYTFSAQIIEEGPELYFAGASGHEPLYHTIRAPILALAGINQASARWLPATAGMLTALLTWALGRRLFRQHAGWRTASLAAGGLVAVSFWSLMYSRVAIRHIGVLPWSMVALYWAWRLLHSPTLTRRRTAGAVLGIGLGTAGALLTYYAGRLMPVLLPVAYPLLAPRRGRWRPYLAGIGLGMALSLPMFWTAAHLPGADARVSELALPIHALREGDPGPLLQTAWTTLGMAHARGDPEWLYNISERPVLGPAGAFLFYAALALVLWTWRRPASRFLLLWLAAGIGPALISLPPSSYGHTILALPAVYLVLGSLVLGLQAVFETSAGARPVRGRAVLTTLVAVVLVAGTGTRDLHDYFGAWSDHGMVRFLYRADYRALARFLGTAADEEKRGQGIAIGSMLFGPWDKIAFTTDNGNLPQARWLDPRRALVFGGGSTTDVYLPDVLLQELAGPIEVLLSGADHLAAPEGLHAFRVRAAAPEATAIHTSSDGTPLTSTPYAGALVLTAIEVSDDGPLRLTTWWHVQSALPLPDEVVIPNPPPPGVYNGPRLKVFAHLYAGKRVIGIDDGLWVDPYSLIPGDVMLQVHTFTVPEDAAEPLTLKLGLYDPLTGARWMTGPTTDHVTVDIVP